MVGQIIGKNPSLVEEITRQVKETVKIPVIIKLTPNADDIAVIAIASVYRIYEAVKIPIIGVGGITTGRDAIEIMMAGAAAVAIGSAVYYRGIDVFRKIEN